MTVAGIFTGVNITPKIKICIRSDKRVSKKQHTFTDEEIEDLQNIVSDTLASICTMADKHNIDRDSMLKYFANMIKAFTEVASIQNYETSRTCNCKYNNDSEDNEPCCRCDSRQTNADRIRNMSDEELAQFLCKVKSDYQWMEHEFPSEEEHSEWEEWLQSEAE